MDTMQLIKASCKRQPKQALNFMTTMRTTNGSHSGRDSGRDSGTDSGTDSGQTKVFNMPPFRLAAIGGSGGGPIKEACGQLCHNCLIHDFYNQMGSRRIRHAARATRTGLHLEINNSSSGSKNCL